MSESRFPGRRISRGTCAKEWPAPVPATVRERTSARRIFSPDLESFKHQNSSVRTIQTYPGTGSLQLKRKLEIDKTAENDPPGKSPHSPLPPVEVVAQERLGSITT